MTYTKQELEEMMKRSGDYLDLGGTQITSLPDNLTVGGSLYLGGTQIKNKIAEERKVIKLKDGMERAGRWVYADGILTPVKRKKKINDYIFYVGKIKGKNVVFDGKVYAHCKSLKEGIQDLEFKHAKERGAEQYRNTPLNKEFTPDEAVTMYRVITGACRQGSESFVNSLGKLKDKYTLKEIIEITDGQYNSSSFKAFFERSE